MQRARGVRGAEANVRGREVICLWNGSNNICKNSGWTGASAFWSNRARRSNWRRRRSAASPAQALGCEPCRIAKTLSFAVGGGAVLVVAAGDAKVDNHKFKEFFGTKAKMLSPAEAETLVGHAVGGVCPFAVNEGVSVYLDESLRRFATVFPACGSSNSAIELTCEELERCADHCRGWADVCKLPAAEN